MTYDFVGFAGISFGVTIKNISWWIIIRELSIKHAPRILRKNLITKGIRTGRIILWSGLRLDGVRFDMTLSDVGNVLCDIYGHEWAAKEDCVNHKVTIYIPIAFDISISDRLYLVKAAGVLFEVKTMSFFMKFIWRRRGWF